MRFLYTYDSYRKALVIFGMKEQKVYDNGYSHIRIKNGASEIIRNSDLMFSPRSVKVWSKLQVELGRSMSEVRHCLVNTRVPVIIRNVGAPVADVNIYQLVKMSTGNIESRVLVNIVEKDNKIIKMTFNRDLAKDKELRQTYQLPQVYQIKLKALNMNNAQELQLQFSKQLNMIVNSLFRGTATFIKAEYKPGEILIYMDADGMQIILTLLYIKETDNYELASMSI